jgi:glycine C-acetyltransferase
VERIEAFLQGRRQKGLLRSLRPARYRRGGLIYLKGKKFYDFSSNDYLGLSGHPKIKKAAQEAIEELGTSSSGSRLLSGDLEIHHLLEEETARFKGKEAALVFNSGYQANLGIIGTVCNREDVIFCDRLSHASILDGIVLSRARFFRFRHNDLDSLEYLLKTERHKFRNSLIITETVFSMDGDIAPLDEIVELAEDHDAMVMVDDCHGEGVLGGGKGIVAHFNLQGRVTVEGGSYSKALGVQGGIIAGSEDLRNHALNHSRSWLLSGSQPPGVAAAQKASIEVLRDEPHHVQKLWDNTEYFRKELNSLGFDTGVSTTPIIPVMCGESRLAQELAGELRKRGVMVGAIVFPMVARDKARVRTQISSGLSKSDLDEVLIHFEEVGRRLGLI